MNLLKAKIGQITTEEGFSSVSALVGNDRLSFIVIETPETVDYLLVGAEVDLVFKETELIIFTEKTESSTLNILKATVKNIREAAIFTRVLLDYQGYELSALSLSEKLDTLSLKEGQEVYVGISPFEISVAC